MLNFWLGVSSLDRDTDPAGFDETLAYLDKHMTLSNLPQVSLILHARVSGGNTHCSDDFLRLVRKWMSFLRAEGYDFEQQDRYGRTPLLDQLSENGNQVLAIVRLLLEFDVNIQATDYGGCNAIQCAMYSYFDASESAERLETKLGLLIEAGVDIHHRDECGETPSYDARHHYGCWSEWCRVLERHGMDIIEVLKAEDNMSLLEEGGCVRGEREGRDHGESDSEESKAGEGDSEESKAGESKAGESNAEE